MPTEETAKVLNALYAEELLERYKLGERNFERINLLRKELESILGATTDTDLIQSPHTLLDKFNPLWMDCRNFVYRRVEWASYGRFIPKEYGDILPRELGGVNLSGINLEGSYLYPVDFSHANLNHSNLRNSIFIDVNFEGADLNHADLRHAKISGTMKGANLYMARLEHSELGGCDLREVNLERAKLQKASLVGADLRGADLSKSHFKETILTWAKLEDVDFQNVKLDTVYVTGASIAAPQQVQFLAALGVQLK